LFEFELAASAPPKADRIFTRPFEQEFSSSVANY